MVHIFSIYQIIMYIKINIILIIGSEPGNFHIVIHNHNLKKAYNELRDFIVKELETQRNEGINVMLKRCVVDSETS